MDMLESLEEGKRCEYNGAVFGAVKFCKELLLEKNGGKAMPDFEVKTVIVAAFPYMSKKAFGGNLSVYACVKDYHKVVKSHLEKLCLLFSEKKKGKHFECFVDVSPINEVMAAAKAGLGVLGENGLLITEEYGSYVFIGEILTDADFEKTTEAEISMCIKCGKCKRSCLAQCIEDKEKCASAISQKKGELNDDEKALLRRGKKVWGCDVCQTVCPMNENVKETSIAEFLSDIETTITLQDIPETGKKFDEKYRDRAFSWRGKAVIKRNIEILNEAESLQ